MTEPPPLPVPDQPAFADLKMIATGQRLVAGNWLDTPPRAAAAIAPDAAEITSIAPNLALVRDGTDTIAVFSRPAGHTRSTVVWAVMREF